MVTAELNSLLHRPPCNCKATLSPSADHKTGERRKKGEPFRGPSLRALRGRVLSKRFPLLGTGSARSMTMRTHRRDL
jgi:hypothetical protein